MRPSTFLTWCPLAARRVSSTPSPRRRQPQDDACPPCGRHIGERLFTAVRRPVGGARVRGRDAHARVSGAGRTVPRQPAQRPVHRRLRVPRVRGAVAARRTGHSRTGTRTCSAACRTSPPCTATSSIPTSCCGCCCRTDVAMTWGFVLHVFLAGLFTYGFLRACGPRLLRRAHRRARVPAERPDRRRTCRPGTTASCS